MRHITTWLVLSSVPAFAQYCDFNLAGPSYDNQASVPSGVHFIAYQDHAPFSMTVKRVEIFTGETSGPHSVAIWTTHPVQGVPGTQLSQGWWSASAQNSWQGADLQSTVSLVTGQPYWVVWQTVAGAQDSTNNANGGRYTVLTVDSQDNGMTWGRPRWAESKYRLVCIDLGTYASYGQGCVGSRGVIPLLAWSGLPTAGTVFTLRLVDGEPGSVAALVTGVSEQTWLGVPLPYDLTLSGAPGCTVACSLELLIPSPIDTAGRVNVDLSIPRDPTVVGRNFYNQWWVFDPMANALQVSVSQGGHGVVGSGR